METERTSLDEITAYIETTSASSTSDDSAHSSRWEAAHDDLLRTWRKEASINLWLQSSSAYYFQTLNNLLTYPAIVFGTTTSVGIFASQNHALQYVLAGLSMASAIMTTFNRQLRAAEKAEQYNIKARDYAMFVREINYIIAMAHDQRPHVRETITRMRIGLDRIMQTQNEPPMHIIRLYERTHPSLEQSISLYADLRNPSSTRPT